MLINQKISDVVSKACDSELLLREEIITLLEVRHHSPEAGYVIASADALNREVSDNKCEIHAQIGLNLSPCPNNCLFCAFAEGNEVFSEWNELPLETVIDMAVRAEQEGANALFVMATGDYPFGKFVEISQELRSKMDSETVMIANVGDFGRENALKLKDAGYKGIYHAVRMGEGCDTRISPDTRLNTVECARDAGLLIGTCVEPVGPEHTVEEIAEKILIHRDMKPCYSGAMRRISIPGSPLAKYGIITEYHMAYLVAVTRLAMGRQPAANCTHEPNVLGAAAGANLFWAEVGTNPRDTEADTSEGRGLDISTCRKIFQETDQEVHQGPSVIYSDINIF